MRALFALLFAVFLSGTPALALILGTAAGTENLSAPTPGSEDPGFANVGGLIGSGEEQLHGTYIGNRWVLAARHTMPDGGAYTNGDAFDVMLNGTRYYWDGNPRHDFYGSDISAFRLTADPGLPDIDLASEPVTAETAVVAIARNVPRAGAYTAGGKTGWYAGSTPREKRWGTNTVDYDTYDPPAGGNPPIWTVGIDFDSGLPTAFECGLHGQDSGSPLFAKVNGVWTLLGTASAASACGVSAWAACHGDTAVYSGVRGPYGKIMKLLGKSSPKAPWKR